MKTLAIVMLLGLLVGVLIKYEAVRREAEYNAMCCKTANKRAEMWRRMTLSYWEQDTLRYGKQDTGYVALKFIVKTGSPFRYTVTFPGQTPTVTP